jgi:hypothetical protein
MVSLKVLSYRSSRIFFNLIQGPDEAASDATYCSSRILKTRYLSWNRSSSSQSHRPLVYLKRSRGCPSTVSSQASDCEVEYVRHKERNLAFLPNLGSAARVPSGRHRSRSMSVAVDNVSTGRSRWAPGGSDNKGRLGAVCLCSFKAHLTPRSNALELQSASHQSVNDAVARLESDNLNCNMECVTIQSFRIP